MARLFNLARMHAATLGTGALIDLGNAVTGFLTFANAGVTDGITVSYAINDPRGGGSEVGSGVYHSSGPSFTRTTVEKSSDGTSRISLSANAEIMITPSAADLNLVYDYAQYLLLTSSALSPATTDTVALGTATKMWSDAFLAAGAVINWNNGDVTLTHSANALAFAGASSGYSFDAIVTGTDGTLTGGLRIGFAGAPTADRIELGDANFYLDLAVDGDGLPGVLFDTGDQFRYDRPSNAFAWKIGGTNRLYLSATVLGGVGNDTISLGSGTEAYSDLFLASGGVINWNNGNATGTHAADALSWAVGGQNILKFFKNAAGSGTYLMLSAGNSAGFQNCEFDVVSDISAAGVSFRMKGDWPFVIHAPSDQSASAKMALYESEANGTDRMVWQAATSIPSSFTLVWPSAVPGANNTPLCCSTGGVLSFSTAPELGAFTGTSGVLSGDRALRYNNQTSSAAAQVGTLTNAPAAGNPGFWLKINVGGTNYAVPCWAG